MMVVVFIKEIFLGFSYNNKYIMEIYKVLYNLFYN